ncbi:MAG TPA: MBOAT family O-acyltransferase [Bacteroidales bacterium]|nr:MBOAT family O-acyltransferase [Bacteroidales bacterium]
MRPLRSFLILLIFLACFTGFHYVMPVERWFPTAEDFLPDYIIDLFTLRENKPDKQHVILPDTIHVIPDISVDSLQPAASLIEIRDTIPINPLQRILDTLSGSSGQTRIMYYGDSQIEGDRFTSYLRHILQKRYSGTGPGLFLPIIPVMYTKSIVIKSSSNWKKYNYLSYRNNEISHNRLGPFMAICRFLPEGTITADPVTATVNIRPSVFADSTSSFYDVLRLFYICREGAVLFTVMADGKYICREALLKTGSLSEVSCTLNGAKDITLEFTGKVSPEIYFISIESSNGVVVDNIPQRGSAGLEFTMVDSSNLAESFRMLSPDLFILQYGLNIVRNVRDEYNYYQHGLQRQISLLKKIYPSVPILVISVTDMASDEEGVINSFKNIPAIIAAQKEATEETGAIFWDSYKAMGGDSSIILWSKKKPALAQKDYVHFTYAGADTLSRIFTDEIFPAVTKDSAVNLLTENRVHASAAYHVDSVQVARKAETKSLAEKILSDIIRYEPDKPMIFTTPVFWIFLLLVLAGYSLIYRKKFLRNFYLLLVSLFFYYKSGGLLLVLLIIITIVDYTCGLLIYNSEKRLARRFFILLSILSNIGLLAYFKYTGFFVEIANDIFGTDVHVHDYLASLSNNILGTTFDISNIILPVGISFFTFQSLSYTFDVYRERMKPVRNIIDFGFYVSFFPQLVAGPIVRASEFIPQLYKEFSLSKREFSHALFLISKGLIKKIIISDFIAVNFVDRVFDTPAVYSGFENLMAVYGYGLQIYCDFSGYTDIAIGLGLIFGFRFPLNFNSPYKATGLTDFWKRWHISLSRWLKDYLYIPLGGNRKGRFRTHINLMLTMLIGGLWHGAALRFIIWGALHGIGLVINRIWASLTGGRMLNKRIGRLAGILITFNFVSFCWIFFRAPDMESVLIMLNQIAFSFTPGSYLTVLPAYSTVFLLIIAGYLIHFLPEFVKESYRGLFIKVPVIMQMAVIMLVAFFLYQMRTTEVMSFIYFRF